MISEYSKKRIKMWCNENTGDKIKPIANLIKLDSIDYNQFQNDIDNCLMAQNIILNYMRSQFTSSELLNLFGIPQVLSKWISIPQNINLEEIMMRVDFLIDENGDPKICEFNIDSSIGGGEIAVISKVYNSSSGAQNYLPYDTLAILFNELLKVYDLDQICILDWSNWEMYGAFDYKNLITTLEYHLPGIRIFQCNEKSTHLITKKTLVYRVFQFQDCKDSTDILEKIINNSGFFLTDFFGEILSNKLWMSILHSDKNKFLLSEDIQRSITRAVPTTIEINEANIDNILKNKNNFFFKKKSDFGGNGVLPGISLPESKESFTNIISNSEEWIVQTRILSKKYEVFTLDGTSFKANTVFGLYKIGALWSGVLVRASSANEIVNVAQGAYIGWGII